MAKTKISEFSSTPGNNTDIDGINIAEGCAPSGINNAIRELMSQLKDFQAGTAGDSFNGPVGTSTAAAGAFTTLTTSSTVTHNAGTANGVAYLNGSKVLTTGSALTFDGTNLGIGTSSPATALEVKGSSPSINVNGTTTAAFRGYSIRSNGTEIASMLAEASAGENRITAGFSGFGGFQTFYTNGLERLRLDSSGNLGLGVTPSAWGGGNRGVIDLGTAGAVMASTSVGTATSYNAYFDGTNWVYKLSGSGATRYTSTSTTHAWYTAPSGTAGNAISFTQAMTLTSGGNLYVGSVDDGARLTLASTAGSSGLSIYETSSGNNARLRITQNAGSVVYNATYSGGANAHVWQIGNAEAARIDSSGNLLVGTTSNPDNNRFNVKQSAANSTVGVYAGTAGGLLNWYKNDNTYLAAISFSGSTVTYGTGSDYRLKENVQPISNALDKVAALRPVAFTWKDDGSYGESFIAHELQELYPTAVNGAKDAVDSEGKPRYQGVDTSKLVAVLTAAIQEQQAIINQLKARLDAANL